MRVSIEHRGRALMLSLASKVKSLARSATIVARENGGREEWDKIYRNEDF